MLGKNPTVRNGILVFPRPIESVVKEEHACPLLQLALNNFASSRLFDAKSMSARVTLTGFFGMPAEYSTV